LCKKAHGNADSSMAAGAPGSSGDSLRLGPRVVPVRVAAAASVARLPALATRLGGELRVLREAALLVRHALPALAARRGSQLAILRETALGARDTLPALSACLCREAPILRETALLIGYGFATHTGDLALPLRVHRGKSAIGRPAFRAAT